MDRVNTIKPQVRMHVLIMIVSTFGGVFFISPVIESWKAIDFSSLVFITISLCFISVALYNCYWLIKNKD